MNKNVVILTLCALAIGNLSYASGDEEELHKIAGRILKHGGKPLAGADVRLLDEQGDVIKTDRSEGDGSFVLPHKPVKSCALEVIPSEDSGLASALIDYVPGNKDRNFIIELHQGCVVNGRIVSDDKGLKGLTIKVVPIKSENEHSDVHGGGFAKTGRDGRFHFTLTPGRKELRVLNERYSDLPKETKSEIVVTAATAIPDIVISRSRQEAK